MAKANDQYSLDDAVLAAAFNDARFNIHLSLCDIARAMEQQAKATQIPEAQVLELYKALKSPPRGLPIEQSTRLSEKLERSFPFIRVLTSGRKSEHGTGEEAPLFEDLDSVMQLFLTPINDLRNYYTHPSDKHDKADPIDQTKLLRALKDLYRASVEQLKTRQVVDNDTGASLLLRGQAKKKPGKKPKGSEEKANFPLRLDRIAPHAAAPCNMLSDYGIVYFCSLFLHKSQAAELHKHWEEQNNRNQMRKWAAPLALVHRIRLPSTRLDSENNHTTLTLDSLTELVRCPRLIFARIHPENQERFRLVEPLAATADEEQNADAGLFRRGKNNRSVPMLLRHMDILFQQDHNDKNIGFAIDLGSYRHNVRIKPGSAFQDGISRVRRLSQPLVGYGHLDDFIEDEKPLYWTEMEANRDKLDVEAVYATIGPNEQRQLPREIVRTHPHYKIYEDKIGLRLLDNDGPRGYAQLDEHLSKPPKDYSEKKSANAIKGDRENAELGPLEPHYWLSPNEIGGLSFYSFIKHEHLSDNSDFPAVSIVLRRYKSGYIKMLSALQLNPSLCDEWGEFGSTSRRNKAQTWIDGNFAGLPAESVRLAALPKALISHLWGDNKSAAKQQLQVKQRLEQLVRDSGKRAEQLKAQTDINQGRSPGHRKFRAIKTGEIASFLVDDFFRFQPVSDKFETGRDLNSQHYQILQATLAFYGANVHSRPSVEDRLREANLLEGDQQHPFLAAVLRESKTGLFAFYQCYLHYRCKYLENQKNKLNAAQAPRWLRLKQHSDLHSWLAELMRNGQPSQPLPLPSGLLYPLLRLALRNLGVDSGLSANDPTSRPSISQCLARYYRHIHESDQMQPFYAYPRAHELFARTPKPFQRAKPQYLSVDKLHESLKAKKDELKAIRTKVDQQGLPCIDTENNSARKLQRKYHRCRREELTIKKRAFEDRLLFLYTRRALKNDVLAGIITDQQKILQLHQLDIDTLETQIDYRLPLKDFNKNARTITHPSCKIKNLGELRYLAKDKRISTLLLYIQETDVPHQIIREELASYAAQRQRALTLVQRLEALIHAKMNPNEPLQSELSVELESFFTLKRLHGRLLYTLYNQLLTNGQAATPEVFFQARMIRNAFCHNEYPQQQTLIDNCSISTLQINHTRVAKSLCDKLEESYSPWLKFLEG